MQTAMLPYQVMWVVAFALYFASKWGAWLTLPPAQRIGQGSKTICFLLGHAGMDAQAFWAPPARKPRMAEWILACLKLAIGATFLWLVPRYFYPPHPILSAWLGMAGFVLAVHCGLFHLQALIWQQAGFGAQPIMRSPLKAESLADFWSNRWNLAFHFLAARFVFTPAKRKFGPRSALLATFLASGLIHELVITIPAQGGYGLPTLYFLIQGLGIMLSQGWVGRQLGLRKGAAARMFAWCVTILPVACLFPPPFIQRVILPFFKDIGAL